MKYNILKQKFATECDKVKIKFTVDNINQSMSLGEIKELAPEFYNQLILIIIAENIVEPDACIGNLREIHQDFVNYQKNNPDIPLLPEFESSLKFVEKVIQNYENNQNRQESSEYIIPVSVPFDMKNSNIIKIKEELLKPESNPEEFTNGNDKNVNNTQQVDSSISQIHSSALRKSSEKVIATVNNVLHNSEQILKVETTSWFSKIYSCFTGSSSSTKNEISIASDIPSGPTIESEEFTLLGQGNNSGDHVKAEG